MNTAVLVRTATTLARRSLWRGGRPGRGLLPTLLVVLLALGSAFAFGTLFDSAARVGAAPETLEDLLAWAFTLAGLMLVLGDLHAVVSSAITAPDLDLLRAAPLSPGRVLLVKLVATLPRTLPPFVALALPAAWAYASVRPGTPWAAFAVALLVLWALPLALGTLLAVPLLRLVPSPRVHEPLALLATVAFVAGWLASAFWVPRLASEGLDLAVALSRLPVSPAWSPATWAARAAGGGPGAPEAAALGVAVTLVAGALAVAVSGRLLGAVQSRAAAAPSRASGASARPARSLTAAFLRRDAALATRDWSVTLDALAGFALWSLLPLAVLPLTPLPALVLARDMGIALSVGLGHDLAARAFPLERGALAWARLSPVGGTRWAGRRALGVGLAGGAVLAVALTVLTLALRLPPAAALDAAAFATAAAVSALATGLAIGARFGDPAWTDPRAMLGAGGRLVSATLLLGQAAVWLSLAHRLPSTPLGAGAALLPLTAAAFAVLPLALAARALERSEFPQD